MARDTLSRTEMRAVDQPSKHQIAYEAIRGRIERREYTPGYRLVLSTLASDLGMSVVPVREAIRQLEAEGLVTFERNVGAQVAMLDDTSYRQSMEALSVLEGAATALAAREITADDLQAARAVNDEMIALLDNFDPAQFTKANRRFHSILFARCTNPRLVTLVEAEWAMLDRLRASTFAFVPDRARESVGEHEQILQGIENEAPLAEIEDLCRRHRAATLASFVAYEAGERQKAERTNSRGG